VPFRVTSVQSPDQSEVDDGDGRITRTVDAAGREFIVTYDTYGNPDVIV